MSESEFLFLQAMVPFVRMSNLKTAPLKSSTSPVQRGRADARANRERVLEAARRVFADRGDAAEIKDIAELAGVGIGTIYRACGSKTDLLNAVAANAIEQFDLLVESALADPDPVEGLQNFLTGGHQHIESFGWLMRLYLVNQLPQLVTKLPRGRANLAAPDLDRHLRSLVERGIAAGAFRANLDLDVAVLMIRGAFVSLLTASDAAGSPKLRAGTFSRGVLAMLSY